MKRALEILVLSVLLGPACDAGESETQVDRERALRPEVTTPAQPCEFDPSTTAPAPTRGVREPTWRVVEDQEAAGWRALAPVTRAELAAARSFSASR